LIPTLLVHLARLYVDALDESEEEAAVQQVEYFQYLITKASKLMLEVL